ncbi:hypothetical protein [Paenibacillus sp. HB172176]|uniref:hypothetical protein n=1 Tax=Paenibacillus sp. HB172176 TaxID=2493690 RepID=UPI00198185DF|nr:hypothetical protein [Paenibacillus sp. HB172176]
MPCLCCGVHIGKNEGTIIFGNIKQIATNTTTKTIGASGSSTTDESDEGSTSVSSARSGAKRKKRFAQGRLVAKRRTRCP